jgi:hypothetical protein
MDYITIFLGKWPNPSRKEKNKIEQGAGIGQKPCPLLGVNHC